MGKRREIQGQKNVKKKHVNGLRHKICTHKLYHLSFESNRGCISTCFGTIGMNWDDPEHTDRVVTVLRLDFQFLCI